MSALEVIPNLSTSDPERAAAFFALLGLGQVPMANGWVTRFSAPASSGSINPSVQVVTRDATSPEDSALTVRVDDVDDAYRRVQEAGHEIVHPLTDEPWGMRRFFVRSPDGHVVNVAQHAG